MFRSQLYRVLPVGLTMVPPRLQTICFVQLQQEKTLVTETVVVLSPMRLGFWSELYHGVKDALKLGILGYMKELVTMLLTLPPIAFEE